jgi:hypothetical protein
LNHSECQRMQLNPRRTVEHEPVAVTA